MGVSCYDPLLDLGRWLIKLPAGFSYGRLSLDYVQYRGPFALGGPALEVFDFHVAHGYLH
jgi:hypothetical protein